MAVSGLDHPPGGFLFPEWVAFFTGIRSQLAPADLFATVDGYWVVPHTFRDGLCDDEY